ncbi:hypothetical protein GCM10010347_22990 [Streptomyces cirratus]|uniref:Uncharacterized protein n=1 Tax=Streptomyces cirratus TaxID=68187 RepID=A0ABQ3EYH5_9ACTN|nr:hypothetical protein [Streptomyces cirratus]GHB52484.1 hypothetical protein GCM10010347_22990 [Streptomyces cirratus]
MTTLRSAASKFTPVGNAMSVRGLVDHLGLRGEVSGRDLMRRLTPQSYDIHSGDLGPSTVTGRAQLVLFSDGFWTYRGQVHESGLVGHDYAFGVVLDYTDPHGQIYAYAADGTVHGTTDLGSRDDDWQQDGWDQRISANWDAIAASSWRADLHVSTNAFAVVEAIAAGLGLLVGGAALTVFAADPDTHCSPGGYQDSSGGAGVEIVCRREYRE